MTLPGARGAPRATSKAATGAAPAPAAAAKSGDALDDEFAALMAEMGEDLPAPKRASGPTMADDDDEFVIPDLVEVGDDELPEGEELPPLEGPAKGKGGAPAKGAPVPSVAAKAGANAAPGGARLPVPAKSTLPAKSGGADGAKKGGKGVWIAVGGAVVAVGGTVAALLAFGVL